MAVSRRSFLTKGTVAAAGAAGAAVVGVNFTTGVAGAEPELDADELVTAEPFMVHVLDASTGEVELLVGHQSVVFTDKALVARAVRASR